MKRANLNGLTWLLLFAPFGALPVSGHHSFAAEYDTNQPVTLTGVVTKVEWLNPHARFLIDVKDASGNVTNWDFELASPNSLIRIGWRKDTLKSGDQVTVEGYRAKDASTTASTKTVKFPDGHVVSVGSSSESGASK